MNSTVGHYRVCSYFSFDVHRHTEQQRPVEAQLKHVVPVVNVLHRLEEHKHRTLMKTVLTE